MPYIEERVSTVETDIAEIKDRLGVIERTLGTMEPKLNRVAEDVAELKAGQVEIRDLLARVVTRLEGVGS
ncbi:hypothetical protein [Streptosporangium longisporum]|uniref:Uncharacterized protein n=1 Tax=Streptosporangium longisporum TaxID=46187 RepID=A0ABN3YDE3_9ACTN